MKLKSTWVAALAILLFIGFKAFKTEADEWDKKTILTVRETIQIPGAMLTPGKYVFRLMDSSSDRHIVQVFNEDQDHILATILATPNYRLKLTGDTQFGFWEMPQGSPPALRSWFYPGDNFGQEFSYPKTEATQVAALTHEEVRSLTDEDQARLDREINPAPAAEPQAEQPKQEVSVEEHPAVIAQVNPQATEYPKEPSTVSSEETRNVPSARPADMPRTASSFPLIGIVGCMSLGVGFVFRRLRN